jgi:DNA-3-methyladenine glycosylase I
VPLSVASATIGRVTGPVTGDDGIARCPWGAGDPVNMAYHDTEWGMRVSGEAAHFERLTLETFQSGLSWLTILNKRPRFRAAFAGFDPDAVAAFGPDDVARLMADAGIVRNQRKVDASIANARATVALREQGGLEELIWSFRPERSTSPRTAADVPTTSRESVALSKALKKAGFVHVGPTTMYALMEAIGLVDDHLEGCHRRGCSD